MDDFDINRSLGYNIAKTNWLMKIYFNQKLKENDLNITPEQWVVLYAINKNPGISQTEIAKISLKDKTNVTRILDLLEKKEYIIRSNKENDRRIYSINLTKKGEIILKKLFTIADAVNGDYTSKLQINQTNKLFEILIKICENIEKGIEK